MAIQKNLEFKVIYEMGIHFGKERYKNILTEDQLSEIPETLEKEFMINGVYCKISQVTGGKEKLSIKLDIYKDSSKQTFIQSNNYSLIPSVQDNAPNFIRQGYEYLKTLPEYSDAIDC